MTSAILFDLDDTLVVEEPAAAASFRATADVAAARHDLDARALARAARARARELWHAGPHYDYCEGRIGMSSWEALWCRWKGESAEMRAVREWSPGYRREAWRQALADQGVVDDVLAEELAERFAVERRRRHEPFPDARPVLKALRRTHSLALVTNGASCLQREKLTGSGLAEADFDAVVVSGDLGTGKPGRAIFAHTLERLGIGADRAVMIGDSVERDVEGAQAAGIRGIWLNRGDARPPARNGHTQIATLAELAAVL